MPNLRLPFTLLMILSLSGIFLVVYSGTTSLTEEQLKLIRLDQLRNQQLDKDHEIRPVLRINHIMVADYFESTDEGYLYRGGVYGGPWEMGTIYSLEELKSIKFSSDQPLSFLTFPMGENGLYINIDRGDEEAVRDFLKIMDQQSQNDFDTLIIDFRFLQSINFGAVIRLFNQIAPPHQITFGTIINAYQEETIKSSGKPFFSPGQTYVVVDSFMPLPIKKLIRKLCEESSYELVGDMGTIPDTVCLQTEYDLSSEIYRICTEKLTDEIASMPPQSSGTTTSDSMMVSSVARMDELWYKERDTFTVKEHLTQFIAHTIF